MNRGDHDYVANLSRLELLPEPATAAEAAAPPVAAAQLTDAPAGEGGVQQQQQQGLLGHGAVTPAPPLDGVDVRQQPSPAAAAAPLPIGVEAAWYRKDANEVLMRDGTEYLRAFIDHADPLPIRGLLRCRQGGGRGQVRANLPQRATRCSRMLPCTWLPLPRA